MAPRGPHPPGPGPAAQVRGDPSVARVAFFLPLVSAVVVAERLPEPGLVARLDSKAPHPLRALPEVASGDDQAGRSAVLPGEGLAVVLPGDGRLGVRGVA